MLTKTLTLSVAEKQTWQRERPRNGLEITRRVALARNPPWRHEASGHRANLPLLRQADTRRLLAVRRRVRRVPPLGRERYGRESPLRLEAGFAILRAHL